MLICTYVSKQEDRPGSAAFLAAAKAKASCRHIFHHFTQKRFGTRKKPRSHLLSKLTKNLNGNPHLGHSLPGCRMDTIARFENRTYSAEISRF